MPRACTICVHPDRDAIDRALVAGAANRRIAAQHAVSEQAIRRHRAEHLPEKLAKAEAAAEVAQADDLLRELRELRSKANALLLKAERSGDLRTALGSIREARACIELLAELEGELDRRPHINLLVTPEWVAVRTAVMTALAAHPDAKLAVVERLEALGAGG